MIHVSYIGQAIIYAVGGIVGGLSIRHAINVRGRLNRSKERR